MNVNNIGNECYIKPKLLLVDDDEITADMIKIFMSDHYQVDWVKNGLDAVSKAKRNSYDVFLIDIDLPGQIDGMEATKRMKEIADNKDKSFIVVTARAGYCDKERFLANGLTHYLAKPFEKRVLLELIDKALNG
jgi:DNA-binding response OmpR family regulator